MYNLGAHFVGNLPFPADLFFDTEAVSLAAGRRSFRSERSAVAMKATVEAGEGTRLLKGWEKAQGPAFGWTWKLGGWLNIFGGIIYSLIFSENQMIVLVLRCFLYVGFAKGSWKSFLRQKSSVRFSMWRFFVRFTVPREVGFCLMPFERFLWCGCFGDSSCSLFRFFEVDLLISPWAFCVYVCLLEEAYVRM